ncbi:MAG: PQQ-binding-like beta-propeller repeat protein [Phycisphaerae bacterium]
MNDRKTLRTAKWMGTPVIVVLVATSLQAADWTQWRGNGRDGVWRESGIVDKFAKPQLDIKWRAPIGGGYSGPTVANGKVYITDRILDPKQQERTHCFDQKTGKLLWQHTYACPYRDVGYDAGPRAAVTVHDGLAYALGAMGNLHVYDADSGKIVWQKDLNKQYKIRMPIWGIAASPLIEKDLVIVQIGGEGNACLVAFDRKTGGEKWRSLEDNASYASPIIVDYQGLRLMICYTGEHVVGMNPADGKVYWKQPFPARRMIIGVADPVVYNDYVFLTNFFDGAMLLRLTNGGRGIEKVWQRAGESEKNTDALHSIIATPIIVDDHIYGVDSYGELRCLKLMTGDRVWEDTTAVPRARWSNIHFIQHAKHTWMFNERGELIIADLSPSGFKEISRAKLIEPTMGQLRQRDGVCWSHPAFADRHIFIRNDEEIVCASLAK